jgi:hypothetical protein
MGIQEFLKYDPIQFLESSEEPWVKYNLLELLGKDNSKEFESLSNDKRVQSLIDECVRWPDPPLKRHNDAGHPLHKIELLADFGLDTRDQWIKAITNLIMDNRSEDGYFLSKIEIPERFGGKGTWTMDWMQCDSPVLLYTLQKFGIENEYTEEAARMLVWNSENNGWRCSSSVPKFRGPGKKDDHCPYGNLVALKALSLSKYKDTEAVQNGIDSHILHWENRTGKKIYMFGIGSTFVKLKYPNVWFDILHVVDVLSRYHYAKEYDEFWEMWNIIKEKQQPEGGFIPESVWKAWSEWSFGQKKAPNPWMTMRIAQIASRLG